jgi:tRNA (guanine-N7-)-methyltransferase
VPAGEVAESPRCRHVLFSLIEPASLTDPLDLEKIFGRRAPLHVDLGCGDGGLLCALAQQMPEKNFLGIERLLGRSNSAARKAGKIDKGNMRVLRMENSYAVRHLLPRGSVETFYLLFPDPWPKRRHQRRRVVNEEFLSAINAALIPGGTVRVATDQLDYFEQIKRFAAGAAGFAIVDLSASPARTDLPVTKFENVYRKQGAPIYRLALRKISPVT